MAKIVIIGCGDVGRLLGERMLAAGHRVTGVRRSEPADPGALSCARADVADAASLEALPARCDLVCYLASPRFGDADSYRDVFVAGVAHVAARYPGVPWLFVSSTGVYGQQDGSRVDETSPAEPPDETRRILRRAEESVLAADPRHVVVRFSGIYGPGREQLIERVRAGRPVRRDPPVYTNRIHREDCAGSLAFLADRLLAGRELDRIYLASDDDPAPAAEVAGWLAARLGVPAPPDTAGEPDAPRNKRCDNSRLRELGFRFEFPTYREGYGPLVTGRDR